MVFCKKNNFETVKLCSVIRILKTCSLCVGVYVQLDYLLGET